MILDKFEILMNENSILYAIVTSFDKKTIENIGSIEKLKYDDLVSQMFNNYNQIKILNESLKEQKLPRSWSQGDTVCVVCKPNDEVLVALFYNEYRPILESVQFGRKIAEEIDLIWKK